MKVVCFHNPNEENGYLSNWYYSNFIVDNVHFISMEQYFMYKKALLFGDLEMGLEILQTVDSSVIKQLGREIKGFDSDVWDAQKENIIYEGLYAKFSQNEDLKNLLLGTKNALLAECAVKDKIWGIGLSMRDPNRLNPSKWRGQNLLGKLLMKVRENL